jgi:hypothetical protein
MEEPLAVAIDEQVAAHRSMSLAPLCPLMVEALAGGSNLYLAPKMILNVAATKTQWDVATLF